MILDEIRNSKYFPLTKYDWPVLRVQVSMNPALFFTGVDDICNYVINNGLTMSPKPLPKYDAWS